MTMAGKTDTAHSTGSNRDTKLDNRFRTKQIQSSIAYHILMIDQRKKKMQKNSGVDIFIASHSPKPLAIVIQHATRR